MQDLVAIGAIIGIHGMEGEGYTTSATHLKGLIGAGRADVPKRKLKQGKEEAPQVLVDRTAVNIVLKHKRAIMWILEEFGAAFFRRTSESKDPYGNRILPAIRKSIKKVFVKLTESEDARQNDLALPPNPCVVALVLLAQPH